MASPDDKSLMRNLGEFFGHIIKGVKTDPSKTDEDKNRTEVRREVEEEDQGDMILRRTTIEEIELKNKIQEDKDEH